MGKCTISDVAGNAGVSISTVSRVLNGNPSVDSDLRARVEEAISKLDYVPNAGARFIRTGASKTLGIIIPLASNRLFGAILDGALDCAMERGYSLLTFSSGGSKGRDADCLRAVAGCAINGLIYCPASVPAFRQVDELLKKKLPVVIAARRRTMPGVPHVHMDDVNGCCKLTKYLLRQGHRRIAFFAGFWEPPATGADELLALMDSDGRGAYTSLDRLEGYRMALEAFGAEFDSGLIVMTGYDYESGYNSMKSFLPKLIDFDAVICSNDWVASGVLQALREQNIQVPGQVSVAGYDDTEVARVARPMLTSVRQFPYEIGRGAVTLILDMIAGRPAHDVVIDTEITVRNSTAMKAGAFNY